MLIFFYSYAISHLKLGNVNGMGRVWIEMSKWVSTCKST